MKRIIIAGGSGFIGKELAKHFTDKHQEVVVLTRGKSEVRNNIRYVNWDAKTKGNWSALIEGAGLLINLTGKSVDCRYTAKNKQEILNSRVNSTLILGQVIEACENPPKLWLNSSTATIYKGSYDKIMTEENGDVGADFSMNVAKRWEAAFFDSNTPKTRKVALRISLVLGKDEGVLPVLTNLVRFGLGGKHGTGKQKFAWIHIEDLIQIIDFMQKNESISGAINCTSPGISDNKTFMKILRKKKRKLIGIPTPKWMLKIGTWIIGTESELILKSRNVYPKRLLDVGFEFKYNDVEIAMEDLVE